MSKFSLLFQKIKSIKHIEIILAILLGLIVLLVFFAGSGSAPKENRPSSNAYVAEIENKLEDLISGIEGAGKVNVMLMWANQNTDAKSTPEILSAVVVSSGANNTKVRLDIIKTVEALLSINAKNIEVLKGS